MNYFKYDKQCEGCKELRSHRHRFRIERDGGIYEIKDGEFGSVSWGLATAFHSLESRIKEIYDPRQVEFESCELEGLWEKLYYDKGPVDTYLKVEVKKC